MQKEKSRRCLAISAIMVCASLSAATLPAAELGFNRHFTDNMVLQREKPVVIKGMADKGAVVSVEFAGQEKVATAGDDGAWSVTLAPMPASAEPRKLTATSSAGNLQASIANILVGDVFLFASQMNVDVSLGQDDAGRKIAAADGSNPLYRAMSIRTIPALEPMADLADEASTGWVAVNAQTALAISAPAYHFGRKLVDDIKVPVGIIDLNMGVNFSLGWISREAIAGSDAFFGRPTPVVGSLKSVDPADPRYPAAGYNAVLHPLKGIGLKGILLQLGNDYPYLIYERMAKAGQQFDRQQLEAAWMDNYTLRKEGYTAEPYIIPRVPYQWRDCFADADLPMALIMPPSSALAPYAMHHVQLRELQRRTAAANPNVGLIMPGNDAIPFSGQPMDADLLASRSVNWALGAVYQREGATVSGPLFERIEVDYSKARLFFRAGTAEGLKAASGSLDCFEVAGIDAEFLPAQAAIDGSTVLLENSKVSQIAYVRYNWREQPDQGLVNAAGLPALPFRSDDYRHVDVPLAAENNLPMEYTTPACDWKSGDVAIVSGSGGSYENSGYIGPAGLKVRPFGPNMLVDVVMPGSPAAGIIFAGDMIYGVNGKILNDTPMRMVADAVTQAETETGGGDIRFGLRRGGKNIEVRLQLEVLGTYSATSPYSCPKTDRIVANMEEYLARRGGEASSAAGGGWLNTDTLFLLGAGTPKYQGMVRRVVYHLMSQIDPKTTPMPKGDTWSLAFRTLLLGEYYLATGDRNVLPCLKWYGDALAATQVKNTVFPDMLPGEYGGWRHNFPGGRGYGMMPNIGLPAVLGWFLADEAGVDLDRASFELGKRFLRDGQAEMGCTMYTPRATPLAAPDAIDPAKVAAGRLSSHNGARGASAVLFKLMKEPRIAHLNSMYCSFAFNDVDDGHGGNFWNSLWTPLGAYVQSKAAFVNFMGNQHWYQDIRRIYNHSYRAMDADPGTGHGLSMVLPRQRLRILGAPESVFGKNQKDFLQPALTAYYARDYRTTEALAGQLLAAGEVRKEDKVLIEQLSRAAKEIQVSIQMDLVRVESLIAAGKIYEASLDIPQLKGVVPEGDVRLAGIEKTIASPESKVALASDQKRYQDEQRSLAFVFQSEPVNDDASKGTWSNLTTEATKAASGQAATPWRVKIVESLSQAPEGWSENDFDDSGWGLTSLPISWYLDHTFLGRAEFEVKDKSAVNALRITAYTFRQQDISVYINGKLVAKVNNCGASGSLSADLTSSAIDALRNGRNTIAVTTRNNWRWGVYNNVHNGGFGFRLDAQGNVSP